MIKTPYRCPICWNKVYPDGCAFWCNNDKAWISPEHIFNIAWATVGAIQQRWNRND